MNAKVMKENKALQVEVKDIALSGQSPKTAEITFSFAPKMVLCVVTEVPSGIGQGQTDSFIVVPTTSLGNKIYFPVYTSSSGTVYLSQKKLQVTISNTNFSLLKAMAFG